MLRMYGMFEVSETSGAPGMSRLSGLKAKPIGVCGVICMLGWLYFIVLIYPTVSDNNRLLRVAAQWPERSERIIAGRSVEKQYRRLAAERVRLTTAHGKWLEQLNQPGENIRSVNDAYAEVARLTSVGGVVLNEVRHSEASSEGFIQGAQCLILPLVLSATWPDYLVFRDELIKRAPFVERETVRAASDGYLTANVRLRWCRPYGIKHGDA